MPPNKLTGLVIVLALLLTGIQPSAHAGDKRAAEEEAKMAAGEALSERGQFEEAIGRWREAERGFERAKDADGEIRALLRQAAACQALGQHHLAVRALGAAESLAEGSEDHRRAAEVKAARGAICIFAREADQAEPLLRESLKAAQAARDTALAATIHDNLGILLTAQGRTKEALAAFEEAARGGDAELAAKARRNMADAHVEPKMMISGLSEATEGFPALMHAPQEIEQIDKIYPQSGTLMNSTFQHDAVGENLAKEQPTIVRIARFFNWGAGWNLNKADDNYQTIYSAGIGLLVNATTHAQVTSYWGHPFVVFNDKKTSLQDFGIHFAVSINAF